MTMKDQPAQSPNNKNSLLFYCQQINMTIAVSKVFYMKFLLYYWHVYFLTIQRQGHFDNRVLSSLVPYLQCILHMASWNFYCGILDVQGTFQKPIEPKITAFDSVLWHGSKFIRPEWRLKNQFITLDVTKTFKWTSIMSRESLLSK